MDNISTSASIITNIALSNGISIDEALDLVRKQILSTLPTHVDNNEELQSGRLVRIMANHFNDDVRYVANVSRNGFKLIDGMGETYARTLDDVLARHDLSWTTPTSLKSENHSITQLGLTHGHVVKLQNAGIELIGDLKTSTNPTIRRLKESILQTFD